MKSVTIYDNGGETIDRYTIIVDSHVYSMSKNALSPQGVNMYWGELGEFSNEVHLGKDVSNDYLSMPHELFVAIHQRVNNET